MSSPYIGEIRMFGGNFAPAGWAFCDGSLVAISENDTLFNLIGTTYGGDGQSTFALPDLRGRVPIHMGTGAGSNFVLAQNGGVENVTLTTNQIPSHNHLLLATTSGAQLSPAGAKPATVSSTQTGANAYGPGTGSLVNLLAASIQNTGGSQPHDNLQPYLGINFIISLFGIFPSPT
jgi:microcystin-dependent protein